MKNALSLFSLFIRRNFLIEKIISFPRKRPPTGSWKNKTLNTNLRERERERKTRRSIYKPNTIYRIFPFPHLYCISFEILTNDYSTSSQSRIFTRHERDNIRNRRERKRRSETLEKEEEEERIRIKRKKDKGERNTI